MTDFDINGYVIVKEFLNPESVKTMSRYMEYRVKQTDNNYEDPISRFSFYADPLAETILYNSREKIERITLRDLYPTYSYSRVYVKGDQLKKHLDRPSCEISVTVNVAITANEPWPIYCKYKNNNVVECLLSPGDAIIYKGCEVEHWREPLNHAEINAQFMLHYVNKNGPYANYKHDKRPALGMPSTTRMN